MWSANMPRVGNIIFFSLNITASILQCLYSLTCAFTICMNTCELCYDMSALESNLLTATELLDLNSQRIISSGNIRSWQRPQRSYRPSCHQNGNPPFTFSHNAPPISAEEAPFRHAPTSGLCVAFPSAWNVLPQEPPPLLH